MPKRFNCLILQDVHRHDKALFSLESADRSYEIYTSLAKVLEPYLQPIGLIGLAVAD